MTNPISKAIVKAAVAMGYGKKSDYKGSSVADVLEKFASIAKDKGGSSGGGVMVVNVHVEPDGDGKTGGMRMVCDKTADEMFQASETKSVVLKIVLADNDVGIYMHIIYAAFGGEGNGYQFLAYSLDDRTANSTVFSAMNADDHPSILLNDGK